MQFYKQLKTKLTPTILFELQVLCCAILHP